MFYFVNLGEKGVFVLVKTYIKHFLAEDVPGDEKCLNSL